MNGPSWKANTSSGIYCPGCQPGDFAQPHICGIASNLTTGYCYACNQPWTGYHVCTVTVNPRPSSTATILTAYEAPISACDHCWCLKQKAGGIPSPIRHRDRRGRLGRKPRGAT